MIKKNPKWRTEDESEDAEKRTRADVSLAIFISSQTDGREDTQSQINAWTPTTSSFF